MRRIGQCWTRIWKIPAGEKLPFSITHFSDGDEIALGYKGGYDLILMDIEMTFLDGMSAAEEIRRADPEVLIIFITNSPQYAIKGYAVQALDYILKPLSYYAFCQRMNHVRSCWGAAKSISSRCPARAVCRSSMSPTFIM